MVSVIVLCLIGLVMLLVGLYDIRTHNQRYQLTLVLAIAFFAMAAGMWGETRTNPPKAHPGTQSRLVHI